MVMMLFWDVMFTQGNMNTKRLLSLLLPCSTFVQHNAAPPPAPARARAALIG